MGLSWRSPRSSPGGAWLPLPAPPARQPAPLIRRAGGDLAGRFPRAARCNRDARWLLAQRLGAARAGALATQEQARRAPADLHDEWLDIPPVRAYLRAGTCRPGQHPFGRALAGARQEPQPDPLDLDPRRSLIILRPPEGNDGRNAMTALTDVAALGAGDPEGRAGDRGQAAAAQADPGGSAGGRPCAAGRLSRPGEDADRQELRGGAGAGVQAHPVHARPAAGRYHRRL